jgi:hypothetical protein
VVLLLTPVGVCAQETGSKPSDTPPLITRPTDSKSEEKAALPFQIQLLETRVRFQSNGDSRKEVHTVVKINDLAGARQFSRLGFDYNRAFQQVEIPLVKISHANGGTSELLPSAVTDGPNPAVEKFPAYQNVRVKSVRILGLQDGDTLEYRVITTTTKAPLEPDFWLEHTFDRSGQVLNEKYELLLPSDRECQVYTSAESAPETASDGMAKVYRWDLRQENLTATDKRTTDSESEPDLVVTTFSSWEDLSKKLFSAMNVASSPEIWAESVKKTGERSEPVPKEKLYELVSSKIASVDLPFNLGEIPFRNAEQILASGYATPQDKAKLLLVLLGQERIHEPKPALGVWVTSKVRSPERHLPRPSLLEVPLVSIGDPEGTQFLEPGLEVAPYGVVRATLRGKPALLLGVAPNQAEDCWITIPDKLPFAASQTVKINAELRSDGTLRGVVRYRLRGDNELLLREAFHQTPKEGWKEVAGLLALADGFRGHIESVTASDPMETKEPFEVEYEITQPKFVDWSKKPVRIPAILPQIALPDPPKKGSEEAATGKIELGTPLDVQTNLKLTLPTGVSVQTPAATSVARDYATYASQYDGHLNTLEASRHIQFLMREIPEERAGDYNAFVRAVQNDQAQMIVLVADTPPEKRK